MMCDECGTRPAVFHLAIIVSGEKQEKNLCPTCMASMKQQFPTLDFTGFAGLLSGFFEAAKKSSANKEPELDIQCESCGTTYETFKKTGLLGCANCYENFHEPLEKVLHRIHGHTKHEGKVPGGIAESLSLRVNVDRLKEQLVKAIAAEEYEAAAELRDRIRALSAAKKIEAVEVPVKEGESSE